MYHFKKYDIYCFIISVADPGGGAGRGRGTGGPLPVCLIIYSLLLVIAL